MFALKLLELCVHSKMNRQTQEDSGKEAIHFSWGETMENQRTYRFKRIGHKTCRASLGQV